MANILPREKQIAALKCLVEGVSLRATTRITGIHRTTIMDLLVEAGEKAADILDEMLYELGCKFVQVDEIWSFVQKKQGQMSELEKKLRPEIGDQYTFVAMCADTKLVITHLVGKRNGVNANAFIRDLGERIDGRFQLSSDGFEPYVGAVEDAFGCDIDYGMEIKEYKAQDSGRGRYGPPKVEKTERVKVVGDPDVDKISTSYIERQNLTMRMQVRRLTRLTNAFSKKLANLKAAIALHFFVYNFCTPHGSLGGITPAMAAGVTDTIWSLNDLLNWHAAAQAA